MTTFSDRKAECSRELTTTGCIILPPHGPKDDAIGIVRPVITDSPVRAVQQNYALSSCDGFPADRSHAVHPDVTETSRRTNTDDLVKPLMMASECLGYGLLIDQPNRARHVRGSPTGHALAGSRVSLGPDDCVDM
jgi:hypothetical protein